VSSQRGRTARVQANVAAVPSRAALDQLPAAWSSVRHAGLAGWHVDRDPAVSVSWEVPNGLLPIADTTLPLLPNDVRSVIQRLAIALQTLHAVGVGAIDLSPDRIYVDRSLSQVVVLPSPWLARSADGGGSVAPGSFVAPEIGAARADVNPVTADVYALGVLAWHLLFGEPRPDAVPLPSQINPALGDWDAVIDGCCRTRAARRFPSVAAVVAALPTGTAPPEPRVEGRPAAVAKRGAQALVVGSAVVLAAVAAISLWYVGGGRAGDGYVRGFAGTVVRYADRTYEGASWRKLYAAANLGNLPALGVRTVELRYITGVDRDNLWVVDRKGLVFRLADGHWQVAAHQPDAVDPFARLIDNETLLVAGWRARNRVYLIRPDGVRPAELDGLAQLGRHTGIPRDSVTPIAPGLAYIHAPRETYKLLEGTLTRVSPGAQKDSIVVDSFGAPVNISGSPMTPTNFGYSVTPAPGQVYAVWISSREMYLVSYRDGAWSMLEAIAIRPSEIGKLTAAWVSRSENGQAFAIFGGAGTATVYRQGRGVTALPLDAAPGATPARVLAIWGVGPEKFWIMDQSGSIWERGRERWRPLIRGLVNERISFNSAWIDATGIVFAVTDDSLYRLQ
jgi:hypothetical protein